MNVGARLSSNRLSRPALFGSIATACGFAFTLHLLPRSHQMSGRRDISGLAAAERRKPAEVLSGPDFPAEWPYLPADFERQDESSDGGFYSQPRLVTHIDEPATDALTQFYAEQPMFNMPDPAILDVASSWISHFPPAWKPGSGAVVALGMNEDELKENKQVNDYLVKDLNVDPALPYPDASFDAVTCAVSVDYLVRQPELMREVNRVLRPGGTAYMSFSNRCFPTKVVNMWLSTTDAGHIWIVGSYFHYAGNFTQPVVSDISPHPGRSDPMYVISATKLDGAGPAL